MRRRAMARDGVLLDAHTRQLYRRRGRAGQPPRGHIPGSFSAPAADALTEAGTFLDAATLRHLFAALGADGARPLGVSAAGISAAHGVAALASIGVSAAMFPGSWSAWSADAARPVVVGATPADARRSTFARAARFCTGAARWRRHPPGPRRMTRLPRRRLALLPAGLLAAPALAQDRALAEPPDPPDRRFPARRADLCDGAHGGAAPAGGTGPAGRGGELRRRGRHRRQQVAARSRAHG